MNENETCFPFYSAHLLQSSQCLLVTHFVLLDSSESTFAVFSRLLILYITDVMILMMSWVKDFSFSRSPITRYDNLHKWNLNKCSVLSCAFICSREVGFSLRETGTLESMCTIHYFFYFITTVQEFSSVLHTQSNNETPSPDYYKPSLC